MIMVCLGNMPANFFEKTSAKSEYLAGMVTFLAINKAIWAFQARWIVIFNVSQAMCTTKALTFLFNAALANFFLSISFIRRVVSRASSVV